MGGSGVFGSAEIDSMALPPIVKFGSEAMKKKIVRDVVEGRKHIALAISEPWAGSDVAGIRTTATRDGKKRLFLTKQVISLLLTERRSGLQEVSMPTITH